MYAGDEFYDDEVTSGRPIDPRAIFYRDVWTVCANCEHGQVHHGHLDDRQRWIDDGKCFVWVEPPRTASGRKKWRAGCRCPGWAPGPLR